MAGKKHEKPARQISKRPPGVYHVPGSLGLALGSGRPELIALAIAEVVRGEIRVTKEYTAELLRIVHDLMVESQKQHDRAEVLAEEIDRVRRIIAEVIPLIRQAGGPPLD